MGNKNEMMVFDMKKLNIYGKINTMLILGMSRLDADIHSDRKNRVFWNSQISNFSDKIRLFEILFGLSKSIKDLGDH